MRALQRQQERERGRRMLRPDSPRGASSESSGTDCSDGSGGGGGGRRKGRHKRARAQRDEQVRCIPFTLEY